MFRQSLRRCATQAKTAASASLISQCRSTLPLTRQIVPSLSRSSAPLSRFASLYKAYSTEAAVAEATPEAKEAAPTTPDIVTKFADLKQLGIHPNLLEAITSGMQYDTMTPVQSMTINPALKGTDMYVLSSPPLEYLN